MRKTFAWLGFGSIAVVMAATALLTSGCGTGSTVNRPIVTSIVPPAGVPAGGTPITINGANFAEFYTTVTIGGVPVDNLVWISSTQLTCTTPPSMTTGPRDIVVTTYEGVTTVVGGFSYFPPPTLTAVNPTFVVSLSGGQSVTLTGTGFLNASVASTTVTFGGLAATNLAVQNDSTLTCDIPAHAAGLVDVQLSNPNGIATLVNAFTYVAPQLFAVKRGSDSELFTLDPGTGASSGTCGGRLVLAAGIAAPSKPLHRKACRPGATPTASRHAHYSCAAACAQGRVGKRPRRARDGVIDAAPT